MGPEGKPGKTEADPKAAFKEATGGLEAGLQALGDLLESRKSTGNTLTPEEQTELNRLKKKIQDLHLELEDGALPSERLAEFDALEERIQKSHVQPI